MSDKTWFLWFDFYVTAKFSLLEVIYQQLSMWLICAPRIFMSKVRWSCAPMIRLCRLVTLTMGSTVNTKCFSLIVGKSPCDNVHFAQHWRGIVSMFQHITKVPMLYSKLRQLFMKIFEFQNQINSRAFLTQIVNHALIQLCRYELH